MNKKKGLFIVLEGGEGAGKTTIANELVKYCIEKGYSAIYSREPGGDKVSEMIRNIAINEDIDPYVQTLLFLAARKRNIDLLIEPALERGDIVIADRFTLSTLIYQGVVQGVELYKIYYMLMEMNCCLRPDLEIILDIDPVIGLNRVMTNDREVSGIDKKGLKFHTKVNNAYLHNTYTRGARCVIDANRELDKVLNDCKAIIDEVFINEDSNIYKKVFEMVNNI